jgi:hypothetical protein
LSQHTGKIAIIGGGVAGSTAALHLGQLGVQCTLFEREKSLISGPPFCHLHAGGNLYREISDAQCVALLRQSIDFLRYYPFIVDYRPTVIAIPIEDQGDPEALLPRLELLVREYQSLIANDPANEVLGTPEHYYKVYSREQVEALSNKKTVTIPQSFDEWMIPVAKHIDMEKVKFPLILVQEYGLNLFRLASGVSLALEQSDSVNLRLETEVTQITRREGQWEITSVSEGETQTERFDYLINAAGFRTGRIDDMVGVPCRSMVEFKAAYVSHWEHGCDTLWPEVIFHGERGTPRGMGQFTPYPGGYFQLHGMTKEITLYEDGLVSSTPQSCQPKLKPAFIEKIERQWPQEEVNARTRNAIRHLAQYIPPFHTATVGAKPLYGAQQIPGTDPNLRVAEVSFPADRYARCEIVKVSSVLDMVDAITQKLIRYGWIDTVSHHIRDRHLIEALDEDTIDSRAKQIASSRDYPAVMAGRNVKGEV